MLEFREMGLTRRRGPTLIGQPREPIRVALPAGPRASLPEWILLPILAGLYGIGAAIVWAGWLMFTPAEGAALGNPAPIVPELPRIENPPIAPSVLPKSAPAAPVRIAMPMLPADDEVILRRMPSRPDDKAPPLVVPIESASLPKTTALKSPRWVMEPLANSGPNFIVPIEVAKMEDADLLYSVRRMKISDVEPGPMRLGVTKFVHDDLGVVLTNMGTGYRYTEVSNADLMSLEVLKGYDVVFLTCSEMYVRDFRAAGTLRQFVEQGGTLYASDLRGDLLQAAFPEYRTLYPVIHGVPQNVDAQVVEPGLRSILGRKQIPLKFESFDWRPAPFDPLKVTVCLQGSYRNNLGQAASAPLLVKFRHKKGSVIFTSFHNSKVESDMIRTLIEYLVFSTVNARSENRLRDMMKQSGYSPSDLRPGLLWPGRSVAGTYHHTRGTLRIALGFESVGAKVKIELQSPSGKKISHADEGLFVIEIPNAEPGAWSTTLTPVWLPFANFPVMTSLSSGR